MWRFLQGFSRNLRTRTPAPSSQTTPRTDDNDNAINRTIEPTLNKDCIPPVQNGHVCFDHKEITQRILGQPSEADILLREFFGPTWKSKYWNEEKTGDGNQSQVISDHMLCVGLGSLWVAALAAGRAAFTTWRSRQWKHQNYDGIIDWKELEERYSDAVVATLTTKDDIHFYPSKFYPRQNNFWKSRLSILPQSVRKSTTVFAAGSKVNSKSHDFQFSGENQFSPVENVTKSQPIKKSVTFDHDFDDKLLESEREEESWDSISDEVIERFTEDARGCSGATYGILGLQSMSSQNYEQAFHRFQLGAKEGYPKALFNVALCYERGIGTEKDIAKAKEAYEKAAEKGHAKAQYNLALILMKKEDITNKVYGMRLLEKAALNGLVQAQSYLGSYSANPGKFQNMKKAVKMFKLAAEQGDVTSKHHLAICYERGLGGLKRDLSRAFDLYSSAASAGHLDAKYQMAVMLHVGLEDVEKDTKLAQELLESAAESGHKHSAKLLNELRATRANSTKREIRTGFGNTVGTIYTTAAIEAQKKPSFPQDHPLLTRHAVLTKNNASIVSQVGPKTNGIHPELMMGILTRHLADAKLMNDILAPQIGQKRFSNRARSGFENQIPVPSADVDELFHMPRSSTAPNLYCRSALKDSGSAFSLEV